jgi:hypothetical protein
MTRKRKKIEKDLENKTMEYKREWDKLNQVNITSKVTPKERELVNIKSKEINISVSEMIKVALNEKYNLNLKVKNDKKIKGD